MKWVRFKKTIKGRPKETGEYIVRFNQDQYTGIKVACYLKYDANEGGFMADHDDIYNLEWLDESGELSIPKEIKDAQKYISDCEKDIGFMGSPEYYEKIKMVANYRKRQIIK